MARWLSERTLSFFTHPVYSEKHMQLYVDAFCKVAESCTKKSAPAKSTFGIKKRKLQRALV
jgi:hypothetical protein